MYYNTKNPPKQLGEFGFIPWQAVVGIVQGAIYGGAAATKYSATKKYLRSQKHTQQLTHAEQEEYKRGQIALKEQALMSEGERQLYEDQRIKTLVIIGVVTTLSVTILGLIIYYYFAVVD